MRLAALYDIHGNLTALEAVLKEVEGIGVGQIVVGGDVLPGPMPRECLDVLRTLPVPVACIRGNGERECLQYRRGVEEGSAVPERYRPMMRWVGQQLRDEDVEWIESWPLTRTVGEVLFCHATPRSDAEMFTRETPEENLMEAFEGVEAEVVVCGHTHVQFDRRMGRLRVVNAGSVGMPFAGREAEWLLIEGDRLELRKTWYDLEVAAGRMRASGYPEV